MEVERTTLLSYNSVSAELSRGEQMGRDENKTKIRLVREGREGAREKRLDG